jgi:binding-protein-dependent transport system inner membrane component
VCPPECRCPEVGPPPRAAGQRRTGDDRAVRRTSAEIGVIWLDRYHALMCVAGMQSIDTALYEAASIDGASRWRQLLHVTLPGLRPTIS